VWKQACDGPLACRRARAQAAPCWPAARRQGRRAVRCPACRRRRAQPAPLKRLTHARARAGRWLARLMSVSTESGLKIYKPTTPGAAPAPCSSPPGACRFGRAVNARLTRQRRRLPRPRGHAARGPVEGRPVQAADGGAAQDGRAQQPGPHHGLAPRRRQQAPVPPGAAPAT